MCVWIHHVNIMTLTLKGPYCPLVVTVHWTVDLPIMHLVVMHTCDVTNGSIFKWLVMVCQDLTWWLDEGPLILIEG